MVIYLIKSNKYSIATYSHPFSTHLNNLCIQFPSNWSNNKQTKKEVILLFHATALTYLIIIFITDHPLICILYFFSTRFIFRSLSQIQQQQKYERIIKVNEHLKRFHQKIPNEKKNHSIEKQFFTHKKNNNNKAREKIVNI